MTDGEAWPASFPPLLWGIATSGHQIEGRTRKDWTARTDSGRVARGERAVLATDHWQRWQQDFELFDRIGIKSSRFSLEFPVPRYARQPACMKDRGSPRSRSRSILEGSTRSHHEILSAIRPECDLEFVESASGTCECRHFWVSTWGRFEMWPVPREPWDPAAVAADPGCEDVFGMEVLYPHGAGLDVHKRSVVTCVGHTDRRGHATFHTRTFGTTTPELLDLQT